MQLAYRHDERPGESYEALDGKKVPFLGPESQLKPGFACAGLLCSNKNCKKSATANLADVDLYDSMTALHRCSCIFSSESDRLSSKAWSL